MTWKKRNPAFTAALSLLLAVAVALAAPLSLHAAGEEYKEYPMLNAYSASMGAWVGWWDSGAITNNGPYEVSADGTVAQALTTGADTSFLVAALPEEKPIAGIRLTGTLASSYKIQYRSAEAPNPVSFDGSYDFSGMNGFSSDTEIPVSAYTKTTQDDSVIFVFQTPVTTKALMFQGNGFNITKINVYESLPYLEPDPEDWFGDGSASTFVIETPAQFAQFPQKGNFAGKKVVLGADMDMSGLAWEPAAFNGIFDGAGHSITGLKVTGDNKGLLFTTLTDAVVMNVIIDGEISGGGVAAGFCRWLNGSSVIVNCMNKGKVASSTRASGIADEVAATAKIANTVFAGTIECSGSGGAWAGPYGIAGWGDMGVISNCYSTFSPPFNSGAGGTPVHCEQMTLESMKDASFVQALNENLAAAAAVSDKIAQGDLMAWTASAGGLPVFGRAASSFAYTGAQILTDLDTDGKQAVRFHFTYQSAVEQTDNDTIIYQGREYRVANCGVILRAQKNDRPIGGVSYDLTYENNGKGGIFAGQGKKMYRVEENNGVYEKTFTAYVTKISRGNRADALQCRGYLVLEPVDGGEQTLVYSDTAQRSLMDIYTSTQDSGAYSQAVADWFA